MSYSKDGKLLSTNSILSIGVDFSLLYQIYHFFLLSLSICRRNTFLLCFLISGLNMFSQVELMHKIIYLLKLFILRIDETIMSYKVNIMVQVYFILQNFSRFSVQLTIKRSVCSRHRNTLVALQEYMSNNYVFLHSFTSNF